MVRMANVYLTEGSLEQAYMLYMKFMTLFLEKIRKHPEYGSVPAQVKTVNQAKLKEVMPKAEKLKQKLLDQYTKEHAAYVANEVNSLKYKTFYLFLYCLTIIVHKYLNVYIQLHIYLHFKFKIGLQLSEACLMMI